MDSAPSSSETEFKFRTRDVGEKQTFFSWASDGSYGPNEHLYGRPIGERPPNPDDEEWQFTFNEDQLGNFIQTLKTYLPGFEQSLPVEKREKYYAEGSEEAKTAQAVLKKLEVLRGRYWEAAELNEEDTSGLDEGVRDLVVLLRRFGFETFDSGDGYSKPSHPQHNPNAHVVIASPPGKLEEEADRLMALLVVYGVEILPMNEDNDAPAIEASYSPSDKSRHIVLFNVFSDTLFQEDGWAKET